MRGIVVAGLLGAAVAGCGTVLASTAASGQAAAANPPASAATAVGCARVSQATAVTVHRTMHLVEPARVGPYTMTQLKPALVRALFSDFCQLVAHPYSSNHPIHCPAAFGIDYAGTFYAGHRELATFVYGASGCQTIRVTAGGQSRFTMVSGSTAAAAPRLQSDMAAVLGLPNSAVASPGPRIDPGGPAHQATSGGAAKAA
ncbi:MAG: hypothetical protein M3Z75_26950 [Actinomycetota bacterium]|nr:hypothetical protein [Actinomycetota bacterium]